MWQKIGYRIIWALRSIMGPDLGSSVGELQSVMGDLLEVNTANAAMLRACGGWKVLDFHTKGGASTTSVQDHFAILIESIKTLLTYDIEQSDATGAACLARMQPKFSALDRTRLQLRTHALQNSDIYSDPRGRASLVETINKDLDTFSADIRKWVLLSFDAQVPADSFDRFPVSIPEFRNVRDLVRSGTQLSRFMCGSSDGARAGSNTSGGEPVRSGNTRKRKTTSSKNNPKGYPYGYCWDFIDGRCNKS